jgi:hypothetical protein
MPLVGFEPTAQVFERHMAGHSLHLVAIMLDKYRAAVRIKVKLRRDYNSKAQQSFDPRTSDMTCFTVDVICTLYLMIRWTI